MTCLFIFSHYFLSKVKLIFQIGIVQVPESFTPGALPPVSPSHPSRDTFIGVSSSTKNTYALAWCWWHLLFLGLGQQNVERCTTQALQSMLA